MNTIFSLMSQLAPQPAIAVEQKFYLHYDPATLSIIGISSENVSTLESLSLEISSESALAILSGSDSLINWTLRYVDNELTFAKRENSDAQPSLTDLSLLIQVQIAADESLLEEDLGAAQSTERVANVAKRAVDLMNRDDFMPTNYWAAFDTYKRNISKSSKTKSFNGYDVVVSVNRKCNTIKLDFDSNAITQETNCRLFFTREDDPSRLLGLVYLTPQKLRDLVKTNLLPSIPNTIAFQAPFNCDDLSIFTIKNTLRIAAVETQL